MPHASQRMCWLASDHGALLLLLDSQPAALLSPAAAAFYGWVEIRFGAVTVAYRMHTFRKFGWGPDRVLWASSAPWHHLEGVRSRVSMEL